jgi:hypothetical protein
MSTGTRHAQSRQPRQRACPPRRIAGAPCPDRVWLAVGSAHLDGAPAQHALVASVTSARCRSRDTVILACSVAVAAQSLMPIQKARQLIMPWSRVQRYRSCSPSQGASSVGSLRCRVLSRARRAGPTRRCSGRRFASSEIVAILTVGICYNGVTVYQSAPLSANPLGHHHSRTPCQWSHII